MSLLDGKNGIVGKLWHNNDEGHVVCRLSPRNCVMREGQKGFCGVRMNVGGQLITVNYGRSVRLTEEHIETEAVYHYKPGARILSLGNIGCMMNCDFCQNWQTSQVRKLDESQVVEYTPEYIVETALKRGIEIISWTYNDPVVWHEFIMDTARLAHENGIQNLYKSAFFISKEAATELCDVIDIFSISLKSMSEDFYRKVTKASLAPVLEAIKTVAPRAKHLEISQLVVTDLNDTEDEARQIARWMIENVGDHIPLHFVRFHPAYKYQHVDRTPIHLLQRARQVALEEGIKYCYLGNVYEEGVSDTVCQSCGALLVKRYGLNVKTPGLDQQGNCTQCGTHSNIVVSEQSEASSTSSFAHINLSPDETKDLDFFWEQEVNAAHIMVDNHLEDCVLEIQPLPKGEHRTVRLGKASNLDRFVISRSEPNETGFRIRHQVGHNLTILPVLDRAHFPVDVSWKDTAPVKPSKTTTLLRE